MKNGTAILFFAVWPAAMAAALTTITVNTDGGGDQLTLSAAYATLPDPFTDDVVINCSGATNDTTAVTLSKATLNGGSTYTLTINGNNTTGIFNESFYQLAIAGAATAILINDVSDRVVLDGLQISGTATGYNGVFISNAASTITIRDCIIKGFTRTGTYGAISMGTGTGNLFYNNICYSSTLGVYVNQGQAQVYNNTCVLCNYGVYLNRGGAFNATVQNNLIKGSTTADWYTTLTGTLVTGKNYTSDATSPDAGCASATITFVDEDATPDYHLDASMNQTMQGIDKSGTFTVDIDGATRDWWDPGADEMSAPASEYTTSETMNPGLDTGLNEGLQ